MATLGRRSRLLSLPATWGADADHWRMVVADLDFVTVGQIDRGIEDRLIGVRHAGAHLHRSPEVTHQRYWRMCATPFSTTATLRPSRLNTIASAGTTSEGVLRGIFSSTVQ